MDLFLKILSDDLLVSVLKLLTFKVLMPLVYFPFVFVSFASFLPSFGLFIHFLVSILVYCVFDYIFFVCVFFFLVAACYSRDFNIHA